MEIDYFRFTSDDTLAKDYSANVAQYPLVRSLLYTKE